MIPEAEIARLVERIVRGYNPEAVGLFGSYATGMAKEGSDLDVVVIKRTREPYERRAAQIHRLLLGTMRRVDVIVLTPEEFERGRRERHTFRRVVTDQIKVLYERPGLMRESRCWARETDGLPP